MARKSKTLGILLSGALTMGSLAPAWAEDGKLPQPEAEFKGKISPRQEESVASWPAATQAPTGAPNVVLILLDDVGFGAASVFGGPVKTPALEQLASSGLRYNRFHVNSLCSPTRASLLTGRNNHEVGFGTIAEGASGFPGYNSVIPKSAATVAEVLRENGYSTAAFGKWHNTPVWEVSPDGPFDRWPTGFGFEYFYGFMGWGTSQWEPTLYRNTTPVDAPAKPKNGYNLNTDLANDSIHWLHEHNSIAPDKPFFVYLATGATHEPLHVSKEWIAKYKGQFDQGWDKLREETFAREKKLGVIPADAELTVRPAELPAWDSLSANQKKLLARQMEVYAAFLAQTDYEVGRVLQAIRDEGKADNTLVLYVVGDNGASGEGGLEGRELSVQQTVDERLKRLDEIGSEAFNNHYSSAWAWSMNTPFQWMKQVSSHLGGTRDPLIVSWPARIKDAGAVRSQFGHVTDVAPTIYEAAGIKFPESVNGVSQIPLEGKSLAYSFDDPNAPSRRTLQYFEMLGNRGIYKDGWWAGARNLLPWEVFTKNYQQDLSKSKWELYDLTQDYSQAHDLAAKYPEKLKELQDVFDAEARRNQVYPLVPTTGEGRPSPAAGKTTFTYYANSRFGQGVVPNLNGHSQRIAAELEIPEKGAEGVVIADGGRYGGFTLYVKDGKLAYEANAKGYFHEQVVSSELLPTGKVQVAFEFARETPPDAKADGVAFGKGSLAKGVGRLFVNGTKVGEAQLSHFGSFDGSTTESLDIGSDSGSPVSDKYASPFTFTGKIDKVTVDLL
jgi:arylsulfatase